MKFDTPALRSPIDQMKVIGQPVDRIDGPVKVTGQARYAYERHDAAPNCAYGYPICSGIAKGRIGNIDTRAALRASGVLAVVTAADAPNLSIGTLNTAKLLGGPVVDHYHQAVALVVAETFEEARAAASLVEIDYQPEAGLFDLEAAKDADLLQKANADATLGDFIAGFASAAVKLDETYTTPDHTHAMMEPHATLASWDGDQLYLWTSNQMVAWTVGDLAKTLGIPKSKIRLMSPFVGGGFGSKLFLRADAVLAALGAQVAKRPVKVALTRPTIANNTTHRPATIQRVRLGADRTGRLTAIAHESWSGNLQGGKPENAVEQTKLLYAGDNRLIGTRLALLNLPEGNAMRAPGEAPGLMALEIAMDELAERLGIDPIDVRTVNDTQVDPSDPSRKFSQRELVECFRVGREKFGWNERKAPGARRDGRWLVGMGVSAGLRNNILMKSGARVRLDDKGFVTVETDMTDIGTGSYTIIAQTAAEMMGVKMSQVGVYLGDSATPVSAGSGAQWGANSVTAGVYAACVKLREEVAQKLGFDAADVLFVDGQVTAGGRSIPISQAGPLVAEDTIEYGDIAKRYQQSTFAAHFAEVGVDASTGETRVRRMLAVCAAGRILNPKTARSQVIGGMTMGIGGALMEELAVDTKRGFFVNHDLAGYEVPVHADVPHQDVVFLDEPDAMSSPMKAKGVGELGLCGVSAAIANAVYNATAIRVRSYPMTLDKMLSQLPLAS